MSKIVRLIKQLCPEGVEFNDIETLINNKSISTLTPPYKLTKNLYQEVGAFPIIDQGKDFIAAYTNDDTALINKGLYVVFGDHTEILKYVDFPFAQGADGIKIIKTNQQLIIPKYLYYTLNHYYVKTGKYTRHFSNLKETVIPIPPLPIQQEIVSILDKFVHLDIELNAELEARKKQYQYYLNDLLNFEGKEVEWKKMGEIGEFIRGNGLLKKDLVSSGIGCIHYGQIYTYYGNFTNKTKSFVTEEVSKKLRKAQKNDLIIATTSENVADVCKTVVWLGDEEICISGETYIFKHNQNPKYLAYHLQTRRFFNFKIQNVTGAKVTRLHGDKLEKFKIPIPSFDEQKRIVTILEKFDTLVNDTSIGIPAEIEARRKQYEYYRAKLLDFKECES